MTKQQGKSWVKAISVMGTVLLMLLGIALVGANGEEMSTLKWLQKVSKPYAGTTIRILGNNQMTSTDIIPHKSLFEQATGIKLQWDLFGERTVLQKAGVELAGGTSAYDAMWSAQMQNFQYVKAGWLQPLDPYVNNPQLTDLEILNLEDFFPYYLEACKGPDGKLYGLPNLACTKLMYYRKDTFNKFGVSLPETMDELVEVCKKIDTSERAAIALRGLRGVHTNVWVFASFMYAMRGGYVRDYPRDMHPILDWWGNVEALEIYADLFQNYSVPGATSFNFDEVVKAMQLENASIIIDGAPLGGMIYNPKQCKNPENIGTYLVPGGPGGSWPGFDSQMWVVPQNSRNKEAAYLFIMWATSPETELLASQGVTTALPRQSVWRNPEFVARIPWDNGNYAKMFAEALKIAHPTYNKQIPEFPELGDLLGIAVSEAITKQDNALEALQKAQAKAYKLLREAGYYKK